MRIVAVEVENFGVFAGRHGLSLASDPADRGRSQKTLIVGPNGSGKTSLFRAIDIALYGAASLAGRASRQGYKEYLRGLIHTDARTASNGMTSARVSVDVEYTDNGQPQLLRFERTWTNRGPRVESAQVLRLSAGGDVEELVDQERASALLPLDLRKMMLVDVAFVDELTRTLQSPGALERLLGELAGLRLVERLRGDLLTVDAQMRHEEPRRQESEMLHTWSRRASEIEACIEQCRSRVEELQVGVVETERAIALKERELFAAGGEIASSRPAFRETLLATESELEQKVTELRDLCQGTLPFSLCPNLCLDLADQLDYEASAVAKESLATVADEWLDEMACDLLLDRHLSDLIPSQETRNAVIKRVRDAARGLLVERRAEIDRQPIHDLSEHDRRALLEWIREAVGVIPDRARTMTALLDMLESTRDTTLHELDRIPDEDGLRVAQGDLRTLRDGLLETSANLLGAQAELDGMETERLGLLSQMRELEEQLARTAELDRVAELVHRARLALADFKSAQLDQRAVQFAGALVTTFNSLSRKQSLLTSVDFDPSSRLFRMVDDAGNQLDTSKLSTGELQLYSMAVLEGLRATAGRQYPLLVDTPLAYLDELHRETLLSTVLLADDGQVVLFATDKEMDANALAQWLPLIDRAYRLDFDTATRSSSISILARNVSREPSLAGEVA
jgi:DNA sulfur modification protein DndD